MGVVITLLDLFTKDIIFYYFYSLLPYLFIKKTLYRILIITYMLKSSKTCPFYNNLSLYSRY